MVCRTLLSLAFPVLLSQTTSCVSITRLRRHARRPKDAGVVGLAPPRGDEDEGRLVRRVGAIKDELAIDLQAVRSIPKWIFDAIGHVLQVQGDWLLDRACEASVVQAGFISYHLREVEEYPWSLAIGNVKQNLIALGAGPCPQDETASKIWQLVQLQGADDELISGISLLLDVPWSTKTVEEGHSSASIPDWRSWACGQGRRLCTNRALTRNCGFAPRARGAP